MMKKRKSLTSSTKQANKYRPLTDLGKSLAVASTAEALISIS